MNLKTEIGSRQKAFAELCRSHKVASLYAFGSSITSKFNKNSDLDFLVEVSASDPIERGTLLISLWDKLEDFFNRKVDLLTNSSLRNPVLRENIEHTKVLVYNDESREILI